MLEIDLKSLFYLPQIYAYLGITRHKMVSTQPIYTGLRFLVIFNPCLAISTHPHLYYYFFLPKCVLDNAVRKKGKENGVIPFHLSAILLAPTRRQSMKYWDAFSYAPCLSF